MPIFTHVVVGTNDLDRSRRFYDAVLGAIKLKRVLDMEKASLWGENDPEFMVTTPGNSLPATYGNGATIGFAAPTRQAVHAFHEAGLKNGGMDEGAPGPRDFTPTSYASYLRDPDGNKICAYCFSET